MKREWKIKLQRWIGSVFTFAIRPVTRRLQYLMMCWLRQCRDAFRKAVRVFPSLLLTVLKAPVTLKVFVVWKKMKKIFSKDPNKYLIYLKQSKDPYYNSCSTQSSKQCCNTKISRGKREHNIPSFFWFIIILNGIL